MTKRNLTKGRSMKPRVAMIEYITERKRIEQTLRNSEERYRELADSITDVFFAMDKDLRYTYWNKASENLTGISAKDAIGKSLYELFPDVKGTRAEQGYLEVLRTGQSASFINEYRLLGKQFVFEITAYPTRQGIAVFTKEITERRRMEEESRSLAQFPSENPNPVLRLDRHGTVLSANEASKPLLQDWDAGIGQVAPKSWRDLVAAALCTGQSSNIDVELGGKSYTFLVKPSVEATHVNLYGRDITERKRMEEELRENEEKYRAIVENSPNFIGILQDGVLKYVNQAATKRLGWTYEELVSPSFDPIEKVVSERFGGLIKENVGKRLRGEDAPPYEISLTARDGSEIPVIVQAARIVYQGRPAIEFVFSDITEHKKADEALRESEERYRLLIERQKEGLCIIDLEERFVFCNPAGEEVFGVPHGNLVGRNVREFTTTETFELVRKQTEKRRSGESGSYEIEITRPNGEKRQLLTTATPWLDKDGRIVGALAIFRDETERKRAEEVLRENEKRFRHISSTISDIAYSCMRTPDGSYWIDWMMGAAERITGYSVEEIRAQGCWRFLVVDEDLALFEKNVTGLAPGSTGFCELRLRQKSGGTVWVDSSAEYIMDSGNPELLHLYGGLVDITERKRAEEAQRRRVEELAALQATVLDITGPHDLPTLLQTIVNRAARLVGAPAGGMYLCDPEKQEARCVVSYNTPHDYTGTVLKYGQGVAGIVAQTGEPLVVDDYHTWQRRAAVFEEERPFRAVLTVPMIWQGRLTGVIHVLDDTASRRFTQADQELLTLFANHAAIAVENTRLLEQEKHHAEELTRYSTNLEQLVKERTDQLRSARERLEYVITSNPAAIFTGKPRPDLSDFDPTYVSENVVSLLGFDAFSLLGLEAYTELWNHHIHPEDHLRYLAEMSRLWKDGYHAFEYRFLHKDGAYRWIREEVKVVRDAAGNPAEVIGCWTDLTERKRLEERLLRVERLAAIGETAAMVGHDLRNPLQGIAGAAYNIRKQLRNAPDPSTKEMLAVIDNGIEYANGIINDLLEFSREMQLQPVPTTPKSIVKQALTDVRIPNNITIEDTTADAPQILADISKLRRVLTNLIENAINAMPEGGKLSISSVNTQQEVSISVRDTGFGIPQDMMAKIWTPLYTTRAKGIGLGLSICRRIVEAHGGSISVESTVGKGTTFTLKLPIQEVQGGELS